MPQENPPLLDKTMNTTEQTSRNLADVLAEELKNIANNVKPDGSDISIDVPGMSATNVDDGFSELKGTLTNIDSLYSNNTYQNDIGSYVETSKDIKNYKYLVLSVGVNTLDAWNISELMIPVIYRNNFTGFYPFAIGTTLYEVRINLISSGAKKLNVISSTASSLCIQAVYGVN